MNALAIDLIAPSSFHRQPSTVEEELVRAADRHTRHATRAIEEFGPAQQNTNAEARRLDFIRGENGDRWSIAITIMRHPPRELPGQ